MLLALVCVVLLGPFVGKPVHVDDPMYIWAAEQILQHPLDFYGRVVAWSGQVRPMHELMQNPPLASYYLALVGGLLGFSELVLHVAMLPWAWLALLGTHRLAAQHGRSPLLAALLTAVSPAFLVSSTTLMCDVMLLAFFVWAIAQWDRGLREQSPIRLSGAALLAALAGLSKYYGAALIPLLGACALAQPGRRKGWGLLLLIPALTLAGYELLTLRLYGHGLLSEAVRSSASWRDLPASEVGTTLRVTLCFVGGGVLPGLVLAPWIWGRRALLLGVAFALLTFALAHPPPYISQPELLALQIGMFSAAGLGLLVCATLELVRRGGAAGLLFGLWIGGTLAFAALANWSINARSLLPLVPALAIALASRLERVGSGALERPRAIALAVGACALAAMFVALADLRGAAAARDVAFAASETLESAPGPLWFQGHWGFQYYMEQRGARFADPTDPHVQPGELLVVPYDNNTHVNPPPPPSAVRVDVLLARGLPGLATMRVQVGAGFYSHLWGPLPFAVGFPPPELYYVLRAEQPLAPWR